jgi:hypothetical protein
MLEALTLVLLLAETPARTTLPRRPEPPAAATPPAEQGQPTDPLYDRTRAATDDAAFVLSAVESVRQGVVDSRAAQAGLPTPELRAAAAQINEHQQATLQRLEKVARSKGWRLPEGNPGRAGTVAVDSGVGGSQARTSANFIIHQIAFHENTVAQYQAQIGGQGDPELKRALTGALPGYQRNLEMLLGLKL